MNKWRRLSSPLRSEPKQSRRIFVKKVAENISSARLWYHKQIWILLRLLVAIVYCWTSILLRMRHCSSLYYFEWERLCVEFPVRDRSSSRRVVASGEVECYKKYTTLVLRLMERTKGALWATHQYQHMANVYIDLRRLVYNKIVSEREYTFETHKKRSKNLFLRLLNLSCFKYSTAWPMDEPFEEFWSSLLEKIATLKQYMCRLLFFGCFEARAGLIFRIICYWRLQSLEDAPTSYPPLTAQNALKV